MLLVLVLALTLQSAAAAARAAAPPPADGPALLVFKMHADAGNRLTFNRSFSHCIWPGVACSPDGRVLRLVAEASGLNGTLAPNSLSRLDQLRVLSLKSNSLTGAIPDLSPLVNLKSLFLSRNLLSGPFPTSLLSLHRLRTLDLSHNLLSGAIPLPLSTSLSRIYSLRLDSNRLTGALPPLNQTTLASFNVSYNNLSGPVPVTAALSRFPASAFTANPGLCGEAVRRECHAHILFFHGPASAAPAPAAGRGGGGGAQARLEGLLIPDSSSSTSASKKMHKKAAAAVAVLAAALLMVALIGVMLAIRKKRLAPEEKGGAAAADAAELYGEESSINDVEASNNELVAATAVMSEDKVKRLGKSGCLMFCAGEAPVYTLEQLMRASAEMLGRGGVGTTYKAVLDNRLIVCVKRLDAAKMGMTGKEAFERHMDAVGRLRHPNLVPLRAYFQAKEERLLVFDYQPNGSLFSLIHGSRSSRAKPLHWTSCLKIAEDVAQGLAYIHQASRLVHGNIKSSNVLLGPDFEACLTDNCLSFLVEEPSEGEDDSGYRAPETRKTNRRLTPRSDIYAFGVLLLELLTGKPPLQHPVLIATDLPVWVRSVREETTEDERIGMMIDIAAACARSSPESRPTTWQVLKMIQEVKETDTGDNDDDPACVS